MLFIIYSIGIIEYNFSVINYCNAIIDIDVNLFTVKIVIYL